MPQHKYLSCIHNSKKKGFLTGFTLVEVLIAAVILVLAVIALYSAILWGKQYVKQSEFVVGASNLGRDEMEVIKAFGIYNADSTHSYPVLINPTYGTYAWVTVIHTRLPSSVDSTYDTETKKFTLASDSNIIVFECNVYLHGSSTTDVKFAHPLAWFQTQMTVGGI